MIYDRHIDHHNNSFVKSAEYERYSNACLCILAWSFFCHCQWVPGHETFRPTRTQSSTVRLWCPEMLKCWFYTMIVVFLV